MQRQTGPGSSLGELGAEQGVGAATMQEKQGGFDGRHVQRACCPSLSQGERRHRREGEGRGERGLGDRAGEVSSLPSSILPSLPGSA